MNREKLYLCRRFPHRRKTVRGRLKERKNRNMKEPKIIADIGYK
jgi:hypothetical protein